MANKPEKYFESAKLIRPQMDIYEKSAIIGYYRNGMSYELMAYIMGISESYAKQIVEEYLKKAH